MTTFLYTWNAGFDALPDDTENASQGAQRIRDHKAAFVERIGVDHMWEAGTSDGWHKQVTLPLLATKPPIATGQGAIYTKAAGGTTRLYFENDVGIEFLVGYIVGEIRQMAFATNPAGWLTCDGSAVSRTTYADLFATIGTTWGVGDGSTTFNLPDLRGRGLIGDGSGTGLTPRTLGTWNIGSESHTMTLAELATHNHSVTASDPGHIHGVTDPGHTHYYNTGQPGVSTGAYIGDTRYVNAGVTAAAVTGISIATHVTGITVSESNAGSSTAFSLMNPSAVIRFVIKY
jgi:microcystin-dependent protein